MKLALIQKMFEKVLPVSGQPYAFPFTVSICPSEKNTLENYEMGIISSNLELLFTVRISGKVTRDKNHVIAVTMK